MDSSRAPLASCARFLFKASTPSDPEQDYAQQGGFCLPIITSTCLIPWEPESSTLN